MTNRAMIYRSGSRWQIVTAFTTAVALHLSAIAIASLHREATVVNPGNEFPIIQADPGMEPPLQSQVEIPLQAPPQFLSSPDFTEPQQPISKTRSFPPIRTVRQTPMGFTANPRALTLNAPRPEYPYEARSRHITGSGIAALTIDPATGLVEDVVMERKHRQFDSGSLNNQRL